MSPDKLKIQTQSIINGKEEAIEIRPRFIGQDRLIAQASQQKEGEEDLYIENHDIRARLIAPLLGGYDGYENMLAVPAGMRLFQRSSVEQTFRGYDGPVRGRFLPRSGTLVHVPEADPDMNLFELAALSASQGEFPLHEGIRKDLKVGWAVVQGTSTGIMRIIRRTNPMDTPITPDRDLLFTAFWIEEGESVTRVSGLSPEGDYAEASLKAYEASRFKYGAGSFLHRPVTVDN